MFEKDWTPEQVGRMTLMDLRILCNEKAPPEPFSDEPMTARSPAEFQKVLDRRNAEKNSWLQ